MLDGLLEVLKEFWDSLKVFQIVHVYERGLRFRNGSVQAKLGPGLHWKLPVTDSISSTSVVMDTAVFPTQTIGEWVCSAMVRYEITDVVPYFTEIEEPDSVIQDLVMTAIREAVETDKDASSVERKVTRKARRSLKQYGIYIHAVTFIDFGKVMSLRLMMDSMVDE